MKKFEWKASSNLLPKNIKQEKWESWDKILEKFNKISHRYKKIGRAHV